MVNSITLGILLDTLQSGEESLRAARPPAAVARTAAITGVARDGSQAETPSKPGTPSTQRGDRSVVPDGLARGNPDPRLDVRAESAPSARTGTAEQPLATRSGSAELASTPRSTTAGGVTDATPIIRGVSSQTASASLELSATAQWLQRSLLSVPAHDSAASIRASSPLMSAAPGDPHALAEALRESISQSGLFYESHLADWVVQQYPESDLRREPQAGWSADVTTRDGSPMTQHAADGTALTAGPGAGDGRAPVNGQVNGQVSVDLLRAQLQALESRQFNWQGELWPGQKASMTIAEDGRSPKSDLTPAWRTHLMLTLPELGQVDVDLYLDGSTLQLALVAAAPHSVELFKDASADLVSSLEAHAHTVASIGIRQS